MDRPEEPGRVGSVLYCVHMPTSPHAFISYVNQDSQQVDELCAVLRSAQIPYWRDRDDLGPGETWRQRIKEAVRSNSLVFIACFSDNSRARQKTYMNEELVLAIDEFRKMPPGRVWLIPVRLDDGPLPGWDLGAGRDLDALQRVDLFGERKLTEAAALVGTLHGLLTTVSTGTALTAESIAEAADSERVGMLRRLTKESIVDSTKAVQLEDAVTGEVRRVLAGLGDEGRFPTQTFPGPRGDPDPTLVDQANGIWALVAPFCSSLQVAVRHGAPGELTPWTKGLQAFTGEATTQRSGFSALLRLRHLPAMASCMATAVTATSTGRWDTAKTVLVDTTGPDGWSARSAIPLMNLSSMWSPFYQADQKGWPQILARTTVYGLSAEEARQHRTLLHTPVPDWLHHVLWPLFEDLYPRNEAYDNDFDRAEVMLGLISQDQELRESARGEILGFGPHSHWFGRSTWHSRYLRGNGVLEVIEQELLDDGQKWPPLRAGLFGGDQARAHAALKAYSSTFRELANSRG